MFELVYTLFRKKQAQKVGVEEGGEEEKAEPAGEETRAEKAQETEELGSKNKVSSSPGLADGHTMPEIA